MVGRTGKEKKAGLVSRFVVGQDAVFLRVFKQLGTEFKKEGAVVRGAKVPVAEARAILTFLKAAGIAVFKRKNDAKTGWFAYEWRLSAKASNEIFAT